MINNVKDFYEGFCRIVQENWNLKNTETGKNLGYPEKIKVDLKKKHLIYNNTYIIKDGEIRLNYLYNSDSGEEIRWDKLLDLQGNNFFEKAERLYKEYYYSTPSERDEKVGIFRAKHLDELTLKEMIEGKSRTMARIELEVFVLLGGLTKSYEWKKENKFFWQSKIYPSFIIKKEYL